MDKQFMKKVLAQRPTLSLLPFSITKISGCSHFIKTNSSKIVDENGNKYYDHALTEIEKGNLIEVANGFISTGAEPNPSVTNVKDTKLVSILQMKCLLLFRHIIY
jgi:hypothetical protein